MTETVDPRTGQTRIQLNDDENFCRFFKVKPMQSSVRRLLL